MTENTDETVRDGSDAAPETTETEPAPAAADPVLGATRVTEVADLMPTAAGSTSSKRPLLVVGALVVVLALVGGWFLFGNDDDGDEVDAGGAGGGNTPASLYDRTFTVTAITEGGTDRPVIDVSPGEAPTMRFTEADGVLVTGCNTGGGPITLDGDRLTVATEWTSTAMACVGGPVDGDPEGGQKLMDQDAWFGTFFEAGPTVAIDGADVTLTTDDAEVKLTEAEPAVTGDAELWGNRWELVSIAEGDTAAGLPATDGSVQVLDTATEGRVGFDGGCNGGSGAASIEGDRLVVEGWGMTEMACGGDGGQGLMDLDQIMATFLASEPTIAIEGDTLTLATETTTVTFRRVGGGVALPSTPSDPGDDGPLPDPGSGTAPDASVPEGPDGPAGGNVGGSSPGSPGADGIFGERWTITQICPGMTTDGICRAAVATEDGAAPVLDLTRDGVLGFTGCNGGGADVALDTDDPSNPRLDVGPVTATKKACADQALMDQDRDIADLLEGDPLVTLDGDELHLVTDRHELVLVRAAG